MLHDGGMAGGMRRRSDLGTLAERTRGGGHPAKVPGRASGAPQPPALPIKPCWVIDRHGRLPGLLLEWRRAQAGFEGRVVRAVLEADGWVVVEDWLPASLLEPGLLT